MSKLRILIADDHSIVRHGLRFVLENDPELEVVGEATDGREAVRLAEELSPKIIVMDIGMPKLSGYEVAHKIREQPWGRDMMLIALCGWGQQDARCRSKEAGFSLHVVQPLAIGEPTTIMPLLTGGG